MFQFKACLLLNIALKAIMALPFKLSDKYYLHNEDALGVLHQSCQVIWAGNVVLKCLKRTIQAYTSTSYCSLSIQHVFFEDLSNAQLLHVRSISKFPLPKQ